jgi:hypothetical protein
MPPRFELQPNRNVFISQQLPLAPTPQNSAEHAIQRALANPSPQTLTPDVLVTMRQAYGNSFVQRLLDRSTAQPESGAPMTGSLDTFLGDIRTARTTRPSTPIQAKLTVTPAGDQYEQEADSVAKHVVQQINAPTTPAVQRDHADDKDKLQMMRASQTIRRQMNEDDKDKLHMMRDTSLVQRAPEDDKDKLQTMRDTSLVQRDHADDKDKLQMMRDTSLVQRAPEDDKDKLQTMRIQRQTGDVMGGLDVQPEVESRIHSARGGGTPIAEGSRSKLEGAFGADFSGVRVHTDGESDALNRAVQARAFTTGQDIFFRQGEYNPGSSGGQELLAHELTHVVQQNPMRVDRMARLNISTKTKKHALDRSIRVKKNKIAYSYSDLERLLGRNRAVQELGNISQDFKTLITNMASDSKNIFDWKDVLKINLPSLKLDIEANNLAGLITEQKQKQGIYKNRDDIGNRNYTTVGFEHEFATMKSGPLLGVTHLEVAESAEKMPFTNKPFILETDADSALELVSPPLLIKTLEGKPIPDFIEVSKADKIFKDDLGKLTQNKKTLTELINSFKSYNLNFTLKNSIEVSAANIKSETKEEYTSNNKTVKTDDIESIKVGKITKGSDGISSQVNFATDAQTYNKLTLMSPLAKNEIDEIKVFKVLESQIYNLIVSSLNRKNSEIDIFSHALARTLSGQFAVPAIKARSQLQKDVFEGDKKKSELESKQNISDAKLTSHVKDANNVWLKDTLMNLGVGIFTGKDKGEDDWNEILNLVGDNGFRGNLAGLKTGVESDYIGATIPNNIYVSMIAVLDQITSDIYQHGLFSEKSTAFIGPEKQTEFLSHDDTLLGARQDTYLPAQKVQMPKVWQDKRLHVVETRGAQGFEQLNKLWMYEKLVEFTQLNVNNLSDEQEEDFKRFKKHAGIKNWNDAPQILLELKQELGIS